MSTPQTTPQTTPQIRLDPIQILQTPAQPAAVIHLTIPRAQIQSVKGPAISEIFSTLGAQGIKPAGPVFSHHLRMAPDIFDFEVGVPVSTPVAPSGRVQPGELPAATVARSNYRGPYEHLGQAWGAFQAAIKEQEHTASPNLWERYVKGPESSPDPADWCTELNQPITR